MHDDVFRRLCRARDYIHESHAEPLQLSQIARQAGISPFHFLRLFRTAFAETPHQCLTRVRLERAQELLSRGAPATEVCLEVGYASLGSFSSLFASRVGRSPRAFQRDVRRLIQVPAAFRQLYVPCCFLNFYAA